MIENNIDALMARHADKEQYWRGRPVRYGQDGGPLAVTRSGRPAGSRPGARALFRWLRHHPARRARPRETVCGGCP